MAEMNQFGSGGPEGAHICARCEALLMDALDHTASPEDQAFFDLHLASCVSCSRMYMDAKRGAAWLEMLRDPRPQPPATLVERIIAQTSGAQTSGAQTSGAQPSGAQPSGAQTSGAPAPVPAPAIPTLTFVPKPTLAPPNVLPFRPRNAVFTFGHRMIQPRLAMTAAMAFFSIALTLNLTGVHLSELRAADLRPANLRRGFYQANAHVVRYYDNLRVVYELEARVHDLQRAADQDPEPAPAKKPDDPSPKPAKKPGPGTSLREPFFPESRAVAALHVPFTFPVNPQPQSQPQLKGDRS